MLKYILKKEDRTVTLSKVEDKWNYRKEFGTALMDNFNFTEDKLVGFIAELEDIGYEVVEEPKQEFIKDQKWTKPDWDNFFSGTFDVKCLKLPDDKSNEEYKKQIERDWSEWNEWNAVSQPLTVLGSDFQPPTLQSVEIPADGETITLVLGDNDAFPVDQISAYAASSNNECLTQHPFVKVSADGEIITLFYDEWTYDEPVLSTKPNKNNDVFEDFNSNLKEMIYEALCPLKSTYFVYSHNALAPEIYTPFEQNGTVNIGGVEHPAKFIYGKNDVAVNLKYTPKPIEEEFVLTFYPDEE